MFSTWDRAMAERNLHANYPMRALDIRHPDPYPVIELRLAVRASQESNQKIPFLEE
jgi:hypothetical protein